LPKFSFIFFLLSTFFVLSSCEQKKNISEFISTKEIDSEIFVNNAALFYKNGDISGVYSDYKTSSLKNFIIRDEEIGVSYVDKIYTETKRLNQLKYEFCHLLRNDVEYLFYNDFEKNNKIIFKTISREIGENSWTVYPLKINPDEYFVFEALGKIILVYYEENLKIVSLNNYEIDENVQISENIKNIKNMKCIYDENLNILNLFYTDDINDLRLLKIEISENSEGLTCKELSVVKIASEIKLYDADTHNGSIRCVLYKEKDYSLSIFTENAKKTLKIGYFVDIHSLKLKSLDKSTTIFYSSISLKENKEDSEEFYLGLVYDNPNKINGGWKEEKLSISKTPINSISLIEGDEKINILFGGGSLQLLELKKDFF